MTTYLGILRQDNNNVNKKPTSMSNSLIIADSVIIALCCLTGILLSIIPQDEDMRRGINALIVAFVIGFLVNTLVFYVTNN